jgi:hypothetical protein
MKQKPCNFVDLNTGKGKEKAGLVGQDYVGCSTGGNYYVFEFDDMSESLASDAAIGRNSGYCLVMGGQPSKADRNNINCHGISAQACTALNGVYSEGDKKCEIYIENAINTKDLLTIGGFMIAL